MLAEAPAGMTDVVERGWASFDQIAHRSLTSSD
jgi:hypothetical protein